MSEPAFKIGGQLYPFPEGFTIGDTILVCELTGMEWQDFTDAIADGHNQDPRAMAGLLAVAVSRAKGWKHKQVIEFVQRIDIAAIDVEGGEKAEDDAGPPAVTPADPAASSPLRIAQSRAPSEHGSDETLRTVSGGRG